MKRFSIFYLLAFFSFTVSAQVEISSFLKNLNIEKDVMHEGAHGIRISYEYDFSKLKATLKDDSIIKKSEFEIVISLFQNNQAIKRTQNFNLVANSKDEISLKKIVSSSIVMTPKEKEIKFIPYSALLIPEGQNTISCTLELQGHDGKGNTYKEKVEKNDIIITKKAQYLMTINLESLVADTFDFHAQYWDGGIFCLRCVAPDINVYFKLGQVSVWDDWSKDSYRYFGDEKSRNISFNISKGDKVVFLVMDNDIMFHDYMGSVGILPKDTDIHKFISCQQSFGRINQCSMQWKVD